MILNCLHIHAIDGYETYKVDDVTIGVRPIWFSVKDRLPKEGVEVLVWDGNINLENIPRYDLATYRKFNNGSYFISGPYTLQGISYWMPLPKPPQYLDKNDHIRS